MSRPHTFLVSFFLKKKWKKGRWGRCERWPSWGRWRSQRHRCPLMPASMTLFMLMLCSKLGVLECLDQKGFEIRWFESIWEVGFWGLELEICCLQVNCMTSGHNITNGFGKTCPALANVSNWKREFSVVLGDLGLKSVDGYGKNMVGEDGDSKFAKQVFRSWEFSQRGM
jgi:hypothetical protein